MSRVVGVLSNFLSASISQMPDSYEICIQIISDSESLWINGVVCSMATLPTGRAGHTTESFQFPQPTGQLHQHHAGSPGARGGGERRCFTQEGPQGQRSLNNCYE